MTGTLTTIARTISEELERAVEAAEQAQNAGIEHVKTALHIACQARTEAIQSARALEEDAARLIAQSIKIREAAERTFAEASGDVMKLLDGVKAPPALRRANKKQKELPPPQDAATSDQPATAKPN